MQSNSRGRFPENQASNQEPGVPTRSSLAVTLAVAAVVFVASLLGVLAFDGLASRLAWSLVGFVGLISLIAGVRAWLAQDRYINSLIEIAIRDSLKVRSPQASALDLTADEALIELVRLGAHREADLARRMRFKS